MLWQKPLVQQASWLEDYVHRAELNLGVVKEDLDMC